MKKFYLLLHFTLLASAYNLYGQCTPPTNQPTNLIPTQKKASIEISFTAAVAGTTAADAYLFVIYPTTPTAALPANGTIYKKGDPIGNGTVVSYGASTTATADDKLVKGSPYTFLIYSANTHCFNTNNPLTETVAFLAPEEVGETGVENKEKDASSILSPLLNFNFAGNETSWSNLTPAVFYGWSKSGQASIGKTGKGKGNRPIWINTFQLGPYIGSTISIKDSTSYLPAIMLPGNAGLEMNYFMTLGDEQKLSFVLCPINLGLKVISGFTDSAISLVQHNIRHSLALNYADKFNVSVQYTQGWHNSIPNSEDNFKKVFSATDTKVAYWNIGLSTRLSRNLLGAAEESPLFLAINWRSLAKPSNNHNLPNYRFFTIGLITNLDLKSGAHPSVSPHAPNINPL